MAKLSAEQRALVEAEEKVVAKRIRDTGFEAKSVYDLVNSKGKLPDGTGEALVEILPQL